MDKPPSRIRTVRLPNEPFLQSLNGYKPAPLDLRYAFIAFVHSNYITNHLIN